MNWARSQPAGAITDAVSTKRGNDIICFPGRPRRLRDGGELRFSGEEISLHDQGDDKSGQTYPPTYPTPSALIYTARRDEVRSAGRGAGASPDEGECRRAGRTRNKTWLSRKTPGGVQARSPPACGARAPRRAAARASSGRDDKSQRPRRAAGGAGPQQ